MLCPLLPSTPSDLTRFPSKPCVVRLSVMSSSARAFWNSVWAWWHYETVPLCVSLLPHTARGTDHTHGLEQICHLWVCECRGGWDSALCSLLHLHVCMWLNRPVFLSHWELTRRWQYQKQDLFGSGLFFPAGPRLLQPSFGKGDPGGETRPECECDRERCWH